MLYTEKFVTFFYTNMLYIHDDDDDDDDCNGNDACGDCYDDGCLYGFIHCFK